MFATHRADLVDDPIGIQAPVIALTSGHGDRVIVQDLVGHGRASGQGSTDRLHAGVVVGAVTEVLEHVAPFGKRRLADPVGPFAPHMSVSDGLAVHPLHHVVTADAGIGAAALGHLGR